MKHSGLVVPAGVNQETGRACWQASCSCGWVHPRVNLSDANAARALSRHIRAVARLRASSEGALQDGRSAEEASPPGP